MDEKNIGGLVMNSNAPIDREETYEEQLKRFEKDIEEGRQAVSDGRYTTLEELKKKYDFLNGTN